MGGQVGNDKIGGIWMTCGRIWMMRWVSHGRGSMSEGVAMGLRTSGGSRRRNVSRLLSSHRAPCASEFEEESSVH